MKRSLDATFRIKRKLINKAINSNFLNHLKNNITTFSGPSEALHTSTSGGGTDLQRTYSAGINHIFPNKIRCMLFEHKCFYWIATSPSAPRNDGTPLILLVYKILSGVQFSTTP